MQGIVNPEKKMPHSSDQFKPTKPNLIIVLDMNNIINVWLLLNLSKGFAYWHP